MNTELTPLGKFLRKLRIDRGEILKDMAAKLNVAISFLSAVETGRKPMPSGWNLIIPREYHLSATDADAFTKAVADTAPMVELRLRELPEESRTLAVEFARRIADFTPSQRKTLTDFMKGEK